MSIMIPCLKWRPSEFNVMLLKPIHVLAPVIKDHEASSVVQTVVLLGIEDSGSLDVSEVSHHQQHRHHAHPTGHQTLQKYLNNKSNNNNNKNNSTVN